MKKFVSFVCAMSMFISTCFGFSDVSKDHWGYKAINSIHKTGIVTGFYDNTFKPDEKVTKEQLATILTIAFNLTGEYSYKFEDVEENNWSNNYIKATWKYFSNIKRGDKYYFEPEMPITREEVAKTMVKVLNIDTSNVDLFILDQFTDRNEFFTATSKSEEMYIALAVQHGIMKGKGGYFAPKDTLTRAEIAAIMYNILGENGEETMTYSDFDLLAYMPETENYMISPFSIKMAMMMAANGAEGETQNEILKAFGIEDIDEYNKFSKEIIKNYNNNENIKLNVANSIWLNTDKEALAQFNEEYKKIITEYFAGTANEVNNSNAVQVINDWCSEKTNGKIEEIITSPDFLAALVNAIYFKGEWRNKFDEYDTVKDEFIAYDDSIVEKEFMNQIKTFNYYEDETMQLVEMP